MASWNVRTLLGVEGSIETAREISDGSMVDERKVDQVLSELDRYGAVVLDWTARDQIVWEYNLQDWEEHHIIIWAGCAKGRGK